MLWGTTIPVAFGQTRCNVLIDTGAMKSCMSQTFYQQLMLPTMKSIYTYQVNQPQAVIFVPWESQDVNSK